MPVSTLSSGTARTDGGTSVCQRCLLCASDRGRFREDDQDDADAVTYAFRTECVRLVSNAGSGNSLPLSRCLLLVFPNAKGCVCVSDGSMSQRPWPPRVCSRGAKPPSSPPPNPASSACMLKGADTDTTIIIQNDTSQFSRWDNFDLYVSPRAGSIRVRIYAYIYNNLIQRAEGKRYGEHPGAGVAQRNADHICRFGPRSRRPTAGSARTSSSNRMSLQEPMTG